MAMLPSEKMQNKSGHSRRKKGTARIFPSAVRSLLLQMGDPKSMGSPLTGGLLLNVILTQEL
jgi:hypothetical protein